MIPANGAQKIENGVDSMISQWMYIFLIVVSEKDSTMEYGKNTGSFRKHSTKINMNPGR